MRPFTDAREARQYDTYLIFSWDNLLQVTKTNKRFAIIITLDKSKVVDRYTECIYISPSCQSDNCKMIFRFNRYRYTLTIVAIS